MPAAARITDLHSCAELALRGPHADPDRVAQGAINVLVEGLPPARMGDGLRHGGKILTGFASVLIGDNAQTEALREAAEVGVPFCEECERARAAGAILAGEIVRGAETVLIGRQPAARIGDEAWCTALGPVAEQGDAA